MAEANEILFSNLHSPEVGEAAAIRTLILVPVAQTEEHGPHLPLNTDAVIAGEAAVRIAQRLRGDIPALVMDTICYGYSVRAAAQWPGTIRLLPRTVIDTVFELCASLRQMGFEKIAVLDSHGNHAGLLRVVSRMLADEVELDAPVLCLGRLAKEAMEEFAEGGKGASCHGGEFETSLMLHLRAGSVLQDRFPKGDRVRDLNPAGDAVFWSTWRRQKSHSGVYGDPSTASADKGQKFMAGIVKGACAFLRAYYAHSGPE